MTINIYANGKLVERHPYDEDQLAVAVDAIRQHVPAGIELMEMTVPHRLNACYIVADDRTSPPTIWIAVFPQ